MIKSVRDSGSENAMLSQPFVCQRSPTFARMSGTVVVYYFPVFLVMKIFAIKSLQCNSFVKKRT